MFKTRLSKETGLSDLLNYAHLIDEGIVVNKDGAFLTTYRFRGPDIQSATSQEMDVLSAQFNRMVTTLEDGWMLHLDELRVPSVSYPKQGNFPCFVAELIDEERRQFYETEGEHFENIQFLTFVWKFPMPMVKTTRHWFVEGIEKEEAGNSLSKLLEFFKETLERAVASLKMTLNLEQLSSLDLLSFLNTCITGECLPVAPAPKEAFIDDLLGSSPLIGGYVPRIGKRSIYTLTIMGYLNQETYPGLLEELSTYPLVYRWSNRFIVLSEGTAERELKSYQRQWSNKVKGLAGILKEAVLGRPTDKVNVDAVNMVDEINEALTVNSNHTVRLGYWTSTVVLMHEDTAVLDAASKAISEYLGQAGFKAIKEDVNALDAYLGSIPGHGSCNARRLFISSLNLAHCLPLHTLWTGEPFSSPSSLLPKNSPPVFYAATTGKTPFRFHADVSDVGHQIVLGPTGSGKSTYLGFLIAQFLRYKDAQIFIFDKDFSHQALTYALDGHYYALGNSDSLAFCPLAALETETERMRAMQWIETVVVLQGVELTPEIRKAIFSAIIGLSETQVGNRSLTIFSSTVQHHVVRDAINYYTVSGPVKLLDATANHLSGGFLQAFEMGWLLSQKPDVYLTILLHLFDQIEERLEKAKASRPTLMVLEEAWLYLDHPVFAKKLKDWLKTLRKQNARVIFTTQSLSDLYDPTTKTLTNTTATLMESCPTKIYLPNPDIDYEIKTLYERMSLNDRQIEILSKVAEPKRHYYVVTPEGRRLIDLGFSDIRALTLAFVGLSKSASKRLLECRDTWGRHWVIHWLRDNDFPEWADYWEQHFLNLKEVV